MARAQTDRLAVVIPAYRPSPTLVDVVRALAAKQFARVVVVDDGSGPEFRSLFDNAGTLPGVVVLRHAAQLGKGAALKAGLNYVLCEAPDAEGIVAADEHFDPDDIERVGLRLLEDPERLVLGRREGRARGGFAHRAAGAVLHALLGRNLGDPQTGLRAIPRAVALRLLTFEANGHEFELEMLISTHQWGVQTVEEPVRDLPAHGQEREFNPLLDSIRIYLVLLRFGGVSLATALLDNLIFILARAGGSSILISQILGRGMALAFSYLMVRRSVFYSQQHHRSALPKYVGLALVGGAVSYGGIRLMGAKWGVGAIPAKLMVETLLFFVNFAVQRLFIFRPNSDRAAAVREPVDVEGPGTRKPLPAPVVTAVVAAVFAAALAVEAHGFRTAVLFTQDIFEPIGVKRFLKYIGMFLGIGVPLLMLAPWSFPALITGLAAVGTAFAVGPMALVSAVFFLISSSALGTRMLGGKQDDAPESQTLATLFGAAAWIFLMTMSARLPVNYPLVWAVLLAIPVALDWRGAMRRLERWWRLVGGAPLSGYAERAAFAALVFVLLAHWFVALKPEVGADALAMHLAVPADISLHHRMTFEPARFVWAVMPMGADFAYAIVYLMGGEYAAHLLDFALLLAVLALLHFTIRRWVSRTASFLLLALFASTPMVQLVTASLFVENVLAAMVAGMMVALWRFRASGERRFLYISAALAGTAMAVKFGALTFVALLIPFLVVEAVRHRKSLGARPALVCALAVLLLLATAVPPYTIAYFKTGNPLFPFLYDKIPSPLIPANAGLVDERFKRPLTWNTLYDLTFRSSLTYEGQNGSFGFQYMVMAPMAMAAVLLLRRRLGTASAVVVALGAGIIIMKAQPNARYVYACMPLLTVPFAALVGWAARTRWLYGGLLVFVVGMTGMNMRFMPSASYYHRDFCLRLPFSRAEHERYIAQAVPVRTVIAYFNRAHAGAKVMMANESAIAGLDGDIYENHWHQINHYWKIRDRKTAAGMVELMQRWGVQYFIATKPAMGDDDIKPAAFAEMLERCTEAEFEQGDEYLAKLQPTCRPRQERSTILVSQGFYDDFDPALLFRGDWDKDRSGFPDADRHTISYTDFEGSEVAIEFTGKGLTYRYTKAPNRGIASVVVDGKEAGTVDLYAPRIEWQSETRFCCFASGHHMAVVKRTGEANPKSTGKFIDLDSFIVE